MKEVYLFLIIFAILTVILIAYLLLKKEKYISCSKDSDCKDPQGMLTPDRLKCKNGRCYGWKQCGIQTQNCYSDDLRKDSTCTKDSNIQNSLDSVFTDSPPGNPNLHVSKVQWLDSCQDHGKNCSDGYGCGALTAQTTNTGRCLATGWIDMSLKCDVCQPHTNSEYSCHTGEDDPPF